MTNHDILRYALAMRDARPKRELTLFDSTCIIVGIIIGAGIYAASPNIAANVSSPWMLLAAFALGGLIALLGALCYAELATAYPREGGEYVFLTRAFGRRIGFLFAWTGFWVVRPGNVGVMAYIFARYANELWPLAGGSSSQMIYALAAVAVLSGVNSLGVKMSKWTQNLLTCIKVVGLLAIVAVGLGVGLAYARVVPATAQPVAGGGFGLAMVFVLFAYGGWNDMSYVAAEVRDPQRNILRALLWGTLAVTAIYLLVNIAFLTALGFQGVRDSQAVASQVMRIPFGNAGAIAISMLICISCLGAIHGMFFTGARVYYALGTEHRLYAWLGRWNDRVQTPLRSLVLQGIVTMLLVAFFGAQSRSFERLVVFTAPWFWLFFLLVGVSLFVLRVKDANVERPYRVALYPLTPVLFCLSTLFMLYSSTTYAWSQSEIGARGWRANVELWWPLAIMLIGVAASFVDPIAKQKATEK